MSAKIGHRDTPGQIAFYCPGCACPHDLTYKPVNPHGWDWNMSVEKPTFVQSVKWRGEPGRADAPIPAREYICHAMVRDGRIQFLDDCTHKLRGTTVDLPDW